MKGPRPASTYRAARRNAKFGRTPDGKRQPWVPYVPAKHKSKSLRAEQLDPPKEARR